MDLANEIKRARLAKRLTQSQVGDQFGISKAAVAAWESGKNTPDHERLKALIPFLGLDPAIVLGLKSLTVAPPGEAQPDPERRLWTNRTLDVFGARDMGGGVMELSNEPIEKTDPTVFPRDVPTSFLIYVQDDCMAPAYCRGDRILLNPAQPPSPGDDVLLISGARQRKATLRKLVAISATAWSTRQYSPAKDEKLSREIWHTAFRVEAVRRR